MKDERKKSIYFTAEMLKELEKEAKRQDRSLSWLLRQAWTLARAEVKALTPEKH